MSCRPFLITGAVLLVVAGCSNTVDLDAQKSAAGTAGICGSLLRSVPRTVADQSARKVEPASSGRAWGDPAIVLRCGVDKPPSLQPTSQCFGVDGVGWLNDKSKDAYVFTTIGREAYVRVTVPAHYEPAADALVDLASAIKATIPDVTPCV